MEKKFYCQICQTEKEGQVLEVATNRLHDITLVRCPSCHVDSTLYLPPNTIPKITVPKKQEDG